MPCKYTIERRVEFSETDLAGIMHFSNFFKFMETAEHAFFRSLGHSISMPGSNLGFPRVNAACRYLRPVKFEDVIEVTLLIKDVRSKAITYEFQFRHRDAPDSGLVAIGELTAVCVSKNEAGKMAATSIPKAISDKLTPVDESELWRDQRA